MTEWKHCTVAVEVFYQSKKPQNITTFDNITLVAYNCNSDYVCGPFQSSVGFYNVSPRNYNFLLSL